MTRTLTITPVLNGYIVQAGCQQIVFQKREEMLTEIGKYLANPEDTEKRYIGEAVNKMGVPIPEPCPPDCAPQTAGYGALGGMVGRSR